MGEAAKLSLNPAFVKKNNKMETHSSEKHFSSQRNKLISNETELFTLSLGLF
jgi:hypothetical protein